MYLSPQKLANAIQRNINPHPPTNPNFFCTKTKKVYLCIKLKNNSMPKLVVTVKDNDMMPRVKSAIKQLTGVENVFTLKDESASSVVKKGKLHANLSQRINSLSKLKDGWDGEDSKAINRQCIGKLKRILDKTDDILLDGWTLFPDVHGYLYLDYTKSNCIAGITMMPDKMVYFIEKDGKLLKNDGLQITSKNLISILRNVNG